MILLLAILLLVLVSGILALRRYLQDARIPIISNFEFEKTPRRALLIFPHPDDEIIAAGTVRSLVEQGAQVSLLCLTEGDQGDTGGLVDAKDLGSTRRAELACSAQILGIDQLDIFQYPDHGLAEIDADELKDLIWRKIEQYQPELVFTYDDAIGLYGHPDHILTSRYVLEVVHTHCKHPNFSVKHLYFATLPQGMIRAALSISEMFRECYPANPAAGLPTPTLAVRVTRFGSFKKQAMLAHRTQWRTFDEIQPLCQLLPPALYYRIFDREYFSEVDFQRS
ncbi:MAG: PIG-L family deacetylase [Cyanobacteria bacterium P01_H01_bin.15]